jgi:hypothetical protein
VDWALFRERLPPRIDPDEAVYQRFCAGGTASHTASTGRGNRRCGLPRDPVRRITQFAVACRACRAGVNGRSATVRRRFQPRFPSPGARTRVDNGKFLAALAVAADLARLIGRNPALRS